MNWCCVPEPQDLVSFLMIIRVCSSGERERTAVLLMIFCFLSMTPALLCFTLTAFHYVYLVFQTDSSELLCGKWSEPVCRTWVFGSTKAVQELLGLEKHKLGTVKKLVVHLLWKLFWKRYLTYASAQLFPNPFYLFLTGGHSLLIVSSIVLPFDSWCTSDFVCACD